MATPKDFREATLPTGKQFKKKTIDLLPRQFKTEPNLKFLNATFDQLISKGNPEKLNAFIGRKTAKSYSLNDNYVSAISSDREAYQLEPSIVSTDNFDNITFFGDYIDYINQIEFFNQDVTDHSKLNSNTYYAWEPHISWDKLVNYSQYYWLPHGPSPITIPGASSNNASELSITTKVVGTDTVYIVTPDGVTENPHLTFYKGHTYTIKINCPGHPVAFSTQRTYVPPTETIVGTTNSNASGITYDDNSFDAAPYDPNFWVYNTSVGTITSPASNLYNIWTDGVQSFEIDPITGVKTESTFVEYGEITFTVPVNAPTMLYYVSKTDINTSGLVTVEAITESTVLNVDRDIIGKLRYSFNNIELSNGMKINFSGNTIPEKYSTGNWYVEGVGESIYLISETSLEVPAIFTSDEHVEFDNELFDSQGYDVNNNFPAYKDYIVINRGSLDRNTWSRYNRWFHKDVISTSALVNNVELILDQTARATRPIVEFNANLQLFNHGAIAKTNVDLVDTFTKDVFSVIEGSLGYIVDGVDLVPGMRVLFTADTDATVNGRIYQVQTVNHLGIDRLTLQPTDDSNPILNETVLVLQGRAHRGKMFYYNGAKWSFAQAKTSLNQPPRFDVFDHNGNSFSNKVEYPGSTFSGSLIFGYAHGNVFDSNLGFDIAYRNIENLGDVLFEFYLHTDTFTFQKDLSTLSKKIDSGLVKKNSATSSVFLSGWTEAYKKSSQPVIREYATTTETTFFKIDVFDNSALLEDLSVIVKVNGERIISSEFDIYRQDNDAYVRFFTPILENSFVVLECSSAAPKNSIGYYKFPMNLESNPLNLNLTNFTLGEIIDHARTISENCSQFVGSLPGESNLRDVGYLSTYGNKIVQHSAPLSIISYHLINRKFNIIEAVKKSRIDYSKFKRKFLRTAYDLGFDGETSVHLDKILAVISSEIDQTSPYYFSDMVPAGADQTVIHKVIDDSIIDYPLMFAFNLNVLSEKAVLVYLNDALLIYGRDYEFVNDTFVEIKAPIVRNDEVKIVHYSKTDGIAVPPTPTKLGLYPVYLPEKFLDTTYQTPTNVIRGHDGSITVAFNDFRDDLLLELEIRIFNNLKTKYDESMFDIADYISTYYFNSELSVSELNDALSKDFVVWSTVVNKDYAAHDFFDQNNSFTFNYGAFYDLTDNNLPGYWRGIYQRVYGTDAPHVRPWEMLGFSMKPVWWNEVYGPAPYTKDNLILWSDLSKGLVKEPNTATVTRSKYVRPTLLNHIPVDESGNLVPPNLLGIVSGYVPTLTENTFKFGDYAPVESAWRKSSEFPFALISAIILTRPAKIFATGFDRSRQTRNLAGQLVYKNNDDQYRFTHTNIVFPSSYADSERVHTSGLINYISDYVQSLSLVAYSEYKNQLSSLQVRLSSKLGGFSTVDKLKVLLDSRSPLNDGNVFVPTENYRLFLNTSAPIDSVHYSGIIIEKSTAGFILKGYNQKSPTFKYFKVNPVASDPVVNIGGIYEPYVEWATDHYYSKGTIVRFDQSYFRAAIAHRSSTAFELKYFAKLVELPVNGGRDIILRSAFEDKVSTVFYGTILKSIQDVVDFILGYGKYLESRGFVFDSYNKNLDTVINWATSAKEFAFWTTQNWAEGAVISMSPAAQGIEFFREYSTVDNIYDPFYGYSVLRQDGTAIEPAFANSARVENGFSLKPRNLIDDGVYHVELNLVQKEHVLLLDNKTVFNDVIYNQIQGYRQDRVKLIGYRTSDWSGDFNIPGFIYDEAKVVDWKPWTDYVIGDTVKYKEFYYSAKSVVPGNDSFVYDEWYKLINKPTPELLPNWEYKAMQFEDFYDLDSNSFETDQQKFAQHLIGYQPRQYLSNIITDDISQYKFYQGMIKEKGTKNGLSKLFDALNSATKESVEFYEEWALRLGQYGAADGFDEIEIKLDESKFLVNPQPIELSRIIDQDTSGFVYKITPSEVYISPAIISQGSLFPTITSIDEKIRTAGFVQPEDVNYTVKTLSELTQKKIALINEGDYFWVGFDKASWNVYRFSIFETEINNLSIVENRARIYLNRPLDADIVPGSVIGIADTYTAMDAIYEVYAVGINYFEIVLDTSTLTIAFQSVNENPKVNLYKFISMKLPSIDMLDSIYNPRFKLNEYVWVDSKPEWEVWKRTPVLTHSTYRLDQKMFGKSVTVNADNTVMAVSSGTDSVHYYRRVSSTTAWTYIDELTPAYFIDGRNNTNESFGEAVLLTDNELFITAPKGSAGGFVAHYEKTPNGFFALVNIIDPLTIVPNAQFGYKLGITGNTLMIASRGNGIVPAAVTSYNISARTTTSQVELAGTFITDLAVSGNTIVVGTLDSKVIIIDYQSVLVINDQILEMTRPELFGVSVAITSDENIIAVGAPDSNYMSSSSGRVFLFKKVNDGWEVFQTLKNPEENYNERFGTKVRFNLTGTQLLVAGAKGTQKTEVFFDSTFDLGTTTFLEIQSDVGQIRVFDKYNSKFVYSSELETVAKPYGNNYGYDFTITDRAYITDPADSVGAVYEYTPSTAWKLHRKQDPVVNIDKIKSVFLYNTKTETMISRLDVVDPIRGKIIGVADQEIKFKTHYDPATYSVGIGDVLVDLKQSWTTAEVGRVWWDLSTVKWVNPYQGTISYKSNAWNLLFNGASVDVYEWVESKYKPSEWDAIADSELGLSQGISGKSKYGDLAFSSKTTYDSVADEVSYLYYFWVKNKTTVPDVNGRKISVADVALYIADPKTAGLRYISILSPTQISLVNCENLMIHKDVAINIRYWVIDNTTQNIHSHYQLISESDPTSSLNASIEAKWIDSLIGYNAQGFEVPDPRLPKKLKYGILATPRQSMFINRTEALKQLVEKINGILINELIADTTNLSALSTRSEPPAIETHKYDLAIDSFSELRFISMSNVSQAKLSPVIVDGRIVSVDVVDSGKGYIIPPAITIAGSGYGASIFADIDSQGSVTFVNVVAEGEGYDDSTKTIARPFTVLIKNDETVFNTWSLTVYNREKSAWNRVKTQTYDVSKYWNYVDWYAPGYSQYVKIDKEVDFAYELPMIDLSIGDIVKIRNQGFGGWMLMEKINTTTGETTVDYKVIGRQNGTIQFKSELYKLSANYQGYDSQLYDSEMLDSQPTIELRIILETLKKNVFVGSLAEKYKELFFTSLRYVFTEQMFVDWAFKTSFVNAVHNLGELSQPATFRPNNLVNYAQYITEVKPYKTKIRDYVSNFESTERSKSVVSDFDLSARYDQTFGKIVPFAVSVKDAAIEYDSSDITTQPFSDWLENVGYEITEILITNPGSKYQIAPIIEIEGYSVVKATAIAYVSQGRITKIVVTNPGKGYLTTPVVRIIGSESADGEFAVAMAVLGNGLVRSITADIKFDRVSYAKETSSLKCVDTFVGELGKTVYNLSTPANTVRSSYVITVNGEEKLQSEAEIYNSNDDSLGYLRVISRVRFTNASSISANSEIIVEYERDISSMTAVDRIEYFYNTRPGQPGKELSQLMTGVEYAGAHISGTGFDNTLGWDATPWYANAWDALEESYDTSLSGGNFTISSAAGINPAEIIVDGGEFVSPMTSYAPEELVPGEIVDTLNIEVEYGVGSGAPQISSYSYLVSDANQEFKISNTIATIDSIFVTLNNNPLQKSEFFVNYLNKTVRIDSAVVGDRVSIMSFSAAGSNIFGTGTIIADGTSTEYITEVGIQPHYDSFVTVNGVVTPVETFEYANSVIGIRFASAPYQDSVINYCVVNLISESIINISKESVIATTDIEYDLMKAPYKSSPVEPNVLVIAGNTLLNPPDFRYFTVSGASRTYKINNSSYAYNTLTTSDIEVYVNGVKIPLTTSYTWSATTNEVKLKKGVANTGDNVVIEIQKNADFSIHENKLTLLTSIVPGEIIEITTFNNHDLLGIKKNTVKTVADTVSATNTLEYYTFNMIRSGKIVLDQPVLDSQYVWISLNGTLLTPGIDYILGEDRTTVKISDKYSINDDDKISIAAFTAPIISQGFGYSIFKDMLDRTVYKKKDRADIKLEQALSISDTEIVVDDATDLATPSVSSNMPGIIMISGERIEYFIKTGNVLSQLRRGTLGTGMAELYNAGTVVKPAGNNTTIPYKDTTSLIEIVSDGSSQVVMLDFIPNRTITDNWDHDTIPAEYGQCNEIEVYVGGRRLRKSPHITWDDTMNLDQVKFVEAEFSVNGVDAAVRLTEVPKPGVIVKVLRKTGALWTNIGESMVDSNSAQALFIKK